MRDIIVNIDEKELLAQIESVNATLEALDGSRPVTKGDLIGVVRGPGTSVPVTSPFNGLLIDVFAESGQRLREGERVAWLRTH